MFKPTNMKKQTGFSLIELIITLVIGSILLSWGVPAYRDFVRRQQAVALANDILGELALARSAAIDRGVLTRFAPVDPTDWSEGIKIITDANGNGIKDPGDQVLRRTNRIPEAFKLEATSGGNEVIFNALGQAVARNTFKIILQPENVEYKRIEVQPSGNVVVTGDAHI